MKNIYLLLLASILFTNCETESTTSKNNKPSHLKGNDDTSVLTPNKEEKIMDEHTLSNYNQVATTHLNLDLTVDFNTKTISGIAKHSIENKTGANKIIFDSKYLVIEKVVLNEAEETEFNLREFDELLGTALEVTINENTKSVSIYYSTTEKTEALDWLVAEQTANKTSPFMYTQGESIFTRSWIPLQDSPELRITYSAKVKVPKGMIAVMSANNPVQLNEESVYHFEMKQSIPCYLLALAVGELEFKALDKRTGVYAEPSMLESCAKELVDMGKMVDVAEELYGPYQWERFDVIVLPPSFPFGGMENPRLTFATPTIIAGDRSLTSLIAHELAHSWSGNLATNSTWDDFWLNEGFTVYFERRITEKLYGKDYADMLALLGYQDLVESIADLEDEDTHLKLDLKGRNPDDGMTDVAYEKGYFMLRMIEESVGREKFDAFLNEYFTYFKFKNLNTEEFLIYINEKLPKTKDLNLGDWLYGPGIPSTCPKVSSTSFDKVDKKLTLKSAIDSTTVLVMKKWTTHEWLHYIRGIDSTWTLGEFSAVDNLFGFTNSGNSEIAAAWFEKSIKAKYKNVYPKLEEFLVRVGRRKFLTPLYRALIESGDKNTALNIYKKARPNYHFVATNTIDELLGYNPQ